MSRHLADCAGDDYCDGGCHYNGIPQLAILKRASKIFCDCDRCLIHHDRKCPSTPLWFHTCDFLEFDPNVWDHRIPIRITETWICVLHGKLGEINGPVHYEVCHA